MPSSNFRTFTDPDRYAAAVRAAEVEMTLTGRGRFAAHLVRIDFHRLWMQRLHDSGHHISHAAAAPGRAIITFSTKPGPDVIAHGVPVPVNGIVCHSVADDFYLRASGAFNWAAMSLPVTDMAALGTAMAGSDLAPARDSKLVNPPLAALARLRRLHAAAGRLAEEAPEMIERPEVARGLEQTLIEAMVGCLEKGEVYAEKSARRQHLAIMRRFFRALEEEPDRALYLPELCAAVGVSDRTLRACCHEHLAMGPKRFLLLRRLHLAHRALCDAAPGATTVTEVATRLGFWELGRFAGAYRGMFGEAPSATLHRPPV
jgi:AraC-like DNA-binding protein